MKREESTQSGTIEELRERRAKKQAARRRQVRIYRGGYLWEELFRSLCCAVFLSWQADSNGNLLSQRE